MPDRRPKSSKTFIALRHQVTVLRRQRPGRLQLSSLDRLLWVWLYRIWPLRRSSRLLHDLIALVRGRPTPARISPLRKGEAFASSVARFEKL